MNTITDILSKFNRETSIDLIIAIMIVAVLYILSPLFSYIIIKIFNIKKSKKKIKENAFYYVLKSFFRILGIYSAILFLKPTFDFSDEFINIVTVIFKIILILTTAIGLSNSLTKNSKFIKRIQEKSEKDIDDSTVMLIIRAIRVIIYLVAFFMIITDLGYDLSGLITGLGLGSVVLTLAAQDTVKNLFGGMMIFMDKHFKVGDYIVFGTYEGTVEDITFRSTKIRTPQNSIAQIPNSEITSSVVVNSSRIEKRRYETNLRFQVKTDLSKILSLKNQILEVLNNDELVEKDTINVTINEVKFNYVSIYTYCYLEIPGYEDFLKKKEELNLKIIDLVDKDNLEPM